MEHRDSYPGETWNRPGRVRDVETDGGRIQHNERSDSEVAFDFHDILDHIDTPLFVVDASGDLVHWNRAVQRLTGDSSEEAKRKAREYGVIGPAFYHDGRRSMTLAEKVVEAPERADEEYGVPRVEEVEYTLYADQSVMKDAYGEDRHISFSAAPLYEDGEFTGVVEMVWDRTDDALQQQQLQGLVNSLQETMTEIEHGNLSARVSVDETEYIDDELLAVTDSLDGMARRLEEIVDDVASDTQQLQSTVADVVERSGQITTTTGEQAETIATIGDEVSQLNATVEEIAATSAEVAGTAGDADNLATDVRGTAHETQDVMSAIANSAADVTADVESLRHRVDEIDEVVDVIHDIAAQTNMLALNASIEAARAGEEGKGFAVVADEVKSLAEESQTRAGEIEGLIQGVKDDTRDTVENLEGTNEQVDRGLEQVSDTTEALQQIVDAVERAAEGIQQVSDATDDQAESTERITRMLDTAIEQADRVCEEVEAVASANGEHAAQVDEIRASIDRLGGT